MESLLKLIPIILVLLTVSCTGSVGTTPPSTTTPPTTPSTSIFDFDTGSPSLPTGKSTPFDQTSSGVTAHFSSPSDPAAFSVQNYNTTFLTLPQLSNNYLYQNNLLKTSLHVRFSREITGITLSFATTDYHGVGEVEEPTAIKLTAYMDSMGTPAVGSATARGVFPEGYTYPQGTLSFDSGGQPFNMVEIGLLYQPKGGTSFFIDNIVVTTLP